MPKLKSVHLVPTYRCNLKCPYCYASKYIGQYPELSWAKYRKVLNLLVKNNISNLTFIGGEPTIWPHLDRAIDTARTLGLQVGVLTNAIRHTKIIPHAITVNGTNLADPKLRPIMLENLKWYRARDVSITLRFNLNAKDSSALLQKDANWALKYADQVSFSPTVPYELDQQLGKVLYNFAKLVIKNKQKISLNRAVPLCIFTSIQRNFLTKYVGLYSRCTPATQGIVINPDGSFLPCVDLALPLRAKQKNSDLNKTKLGYEKIIAELHMKPTYEKCKKCKYFPDTCQGGCLTMKCGS